MADNLPIISDVNKYYNWIRSGYATLITKTGIQPFVEFEIDSFQCDTLSGIRRNNNLTPDSTCSECNLKDVSDPLTKCPKNICLDFKREIKKAHVKRKPSNVNNSVPGWCTSSWEIAKCYMPPNTYKHVTSATKTDFNGIISVAINFKPICSKIDLEIFEKGRDAVNKFRHAPTLQMEDDELQKHFSAMNDVLSNVKQAVHRHDDIHAVDEALNLLKQLQENTLYIGIENVMEVFTERQDTHDTNKEEQILKLTKNFVHAAERREGPKLSAENFMTALSRTKDEILTYSLNVQALQKDLVTFYRRTNEYSTVPVPPLITEIQAPIEEFYAKQNLRQVNLNKVRNQEQGKDNITSLEDMFTADSTSCQTIFLKGEAGIGKTTFVKQLCSLWCFAKNGEEEIPEGVSISAVDTLNKFEIVFLVFLRNVQESENCIEDMIFTQIVNHLSSHSNCKDLIRDVLHQEKCLVILDGLDEWSQTPSECKEKPTGPLPHIRAHPKCTLLCTTRPWKLFQVRRNNNRIDKCIELLGLQPEVFSDFVGNVWKVLQEKAGGQGVKNEELSNQLKEPAIAELISTPLILIQLICLHHDRRDFGKSKCEIYGNILNFMLEHGADRMPGQSKTVRDGNLDSSDIVLALGQVASGVLTKGKTCYDFGFSEISEGLKDDHLQIALEMGLLTETKNNGAFEVARRPEKRYSFIHKTMQDFLIARYLAFTNSENFKDVLYKMCSSAEKVLEMSDIFVFLSGLCQSQVSRGIFAHVDEIISNDPLLQSFRRKVSTSIEWDMNGKVLKELQDMYALCMKECEMHREEILDVILEVLVIDEDSRNTKQLMNLVERNKDNIKSIVLYSGSSDGIGSNIKDFKLTELKDLDQLEIIGKLSRGDLESLITGSTNTMKCLSVCKDIRRLGTQYDPFEENSFRSILKMSSLGAVMLECLTIDHRMLQGLFDFLKGRTTMREICLGYIKCKVHGGDCIGFPLDLSKHSSLSMLELGSIPISEVDINMDLLQEVRIGSFNSDIILPTVLENIQKAMALQRLMIFGIERSNEIVDVLNVLPTLKTISVLMMKRLDLGTQSINFQSNVMHVKMSNVQMSSSTFDGIVTKAYNERHSTKLEFLSCTVTPENEYKIIKRKIQESERFEILCDRSGKGKQCDIVFSSKDISNQDVLVYSSSGTEPEQDTSDQEVLIYSRLGTEHEQIISSL